MKKCVSCGEYKEPIDFSRDKRKKDGLVSRCKPCLKEYKKKWYDSNKMPNSKRSSEWLEKRREYNKKWYAENKDKRSEYNKKWQTENKERRREYSRKYSAEYRNKNRDRIKKNNDIYVEKNRDKINKNSSRYNKRRRRDDFLFKLKENVRCRIYKSFNKNGYSKKSKTQEMLGEDWNVVKQYIENQFSGNINWSNKSDWHIDHIVPLSLANDEETLMELCHYSNLQPLIAKDNLSKNNRFIDKKNYQKVLKNHPKPQLIKNIVMKSGINLI